ncbi:MAG: hypothetical protein CM15mP120_10500 [Pseudomonadota bacterium]|nr:MAG: hypothetical protein CM15mP120_10500 [Pseudomonadota bacterium]
MFCLEPQKLTFRKKGNDSGQPMAEILVKRRQMILVVSLQEEVLEPEPPLSPIIIWGYEMAIPI